MKISGFLHRNIQQNIEKWLFQEKVIVLYGARQVGKTTLCKAILKKYNGLYWNAEKPSIRDLFLTRNISDILLSLEGKTCVVLDEAQKIPGIGEILKLLIDEHPHIQWIATGSSSFDLANETAEPLTGRKVSFLLFPLSVHEMELTPLSFPETLSSLLRFGSYPGIKMRRSEEEKKVLLEELASDYLYKDVLELERVKNPLLLRKLLKALALQLGSEVSKRELAVLLQTSNETIERYIGLLEKSFVLFSLPAFSTNPRKELGKKQKYYFYDLGIRNSLLQNFAPLDLRTDTGALWENFCIVERMKAISARGERRNLYFWRSYAQKEIDLIEEQDGKQEAFEMKWNTEKRVNIPKSFEEIHGKTPFMLVHPKSFFQWMSPLL